MIFIKYDDIITPQSVINTQILSWGYTKMLTEQRHSIILETLNRQQSVKLSELSELLNTSESTIRRDLNFLAEKGLLTKVHGGAIALDGQFTGVEHDVEVKSKLFIAEKQAIAKYAASFIEDGDFIFIDAGTTTEKLIDYLPEKNVSFVTNGFIHAKKLAQRGFTVFVPGGEIKLSTEAIVGTECVLSLQSYNFTKCFIGVNGISLSAGLTTPDKNEACVKTTAINRSREAFILSDHSKFEKITSVTFAPLSGCEIITDKLENIEFSAKAKIKEVL